MIFLLSIRRQISWSIWPRVEDWKKILSYAVCFGLLTHIFFQSSTHDQITHIFETKKVFLFNLYRVFFYDFFPSIMTAALMFWWHFYFCSETCPTRQVARCHTIVPSSELDSFSLKFLGLKTNNTLHLLAIFFLEII